MTPAGGEYEHRVPSRRDPRRCAASSGWTGPILDNASRTRALTVFRARSASSPSLRSRWPRPAAAAITVRTALRNRPGGLPFALTWWSFTFPVGTCVTGTIVLAARSHAGALEAASVVLYGLLVFAWLVVGARTVSGAASGRLFAPGAAISRALST